MASRLRCRPGHQTRSRTWGSCPLESLPLRVFHKRLVAAGLAESYEAAHARLAAECMAVACARRKLMAAGRLPRLPGASQTAADRSYLETVSRLCDGLEKVLQSYAKADDQQKRRIYRLWTVGAGSPKKW